MLRQQKHQQLMRAMKSKEALRKAMTSQLRALPQEEMETGSTLLCERLRDLPAVRDAQRIMAFLNMPCEVCIDTFIVEAIQAGKEIYVPQCLKNHHMEAVRLYSPDDTVCGIYGIRTAPASNPRIPPDMLDCILVPGLAFDASLRRLGRGCGYYDRFLPRCGDAWFLGLAWDKQILRSVPVDSYDVPMSAVLTERQYIY